MNGSEVGGQGAGLPGVVIGPAPAGFEDWSGLLHLLRESFAFMDGRIDPPSSLQAMDEAALRDKAGHETLLLAWDGPRLVGCAFAALRADAVYLGKLAVAAPWRGRGLARALVAAVEGLALAQGRTVVELQTRVELVENQACFEALGFSVSARSAHPGFSRTTSLTYRKRVAGM